RGIAITVVGTTDAPQMTSHACSGVRRSAASFARNSANERRNRRAVGNANWQHSTALERKPQTKTKEVMNDKFDELAKGSIGHAAWRAEEIRRRRGGYGAGVVAVGQQGRGGVSLREPMQARLQ